MNIEKINEIKKGLECCSILMDNTKTAEEQDNACSECPYRKNDRCSWELDADALTLIKELESENKVLRKHNIGYHVANNYEAQEQLQQFAERLKEKIKALDKYYSNDIIDMQYNGITVNDIDETLKEFKK